MKKPIEKHPEDFCQKCGNKNVVWSAPTEIWDKVFPEEGIVCPQCFAFSAEELGYSTMFRAECIIKK